MIANCNFGALGGWGSELGSYDLAGFKNSFQGGFSVEALEPGSFSGRLGSDSGGLPHCTSDFRSVAPTFGL